MPQVNHDRNTQVYQLWGSGKTVSEISRLTGIPRSTVGYYVRKFNKAAKDGRPIPVPPVTKRQPEELALSAILKWRFFDHILGLGRTSDSQRTYYELASLKLIAELWPYFRLTSEELEALNSALRKVGASLQGREGLSSAFSSKGRSLNELFTDRPKEA